MNYYFFGFYWCVNSGESLTNWFLVWFLFYGPSTYFRSFRAWSVTLTTLFWASLLGSLPVLSAHSLVSNWQLLFLNQRKRENGRKHFFMTKSPRKNMPDLGIKLRAACMPDRDWLSLWVVRQSLHIDKIPKNNFRSYNSCENDELKIY